MSIFDDMTTALEAYPETDVQLEIVEVTFPGDVIDVTEEGKFKVKITNNGALNLTDVTLKIAGLFGTTVAPNGLGGSFGDPFVTGPIPLVPPHGGSALTTGGPLRFKAPSEDHTSRPLFQATLEEWNANLDHIFSGGNHSGPHPTVKATFSAAVDPE